MTNLIKIIKKDFIGYRKTLVWSLFYIVIFPFCFMAMSGKDGAYTMVTMLAAYMVIGSMISYDERYKADMLIGILPVKRSTVIFAKMVELDMVYLAAVAFYFIAGYLNHFFPVVLYDYPTTDYCIGGWLGISLLSLLLLPLSYKFGYQKSRMMSFVIVFLTIGLSFGILAFINVGSFTENLTPPVFSGIPFYMTAAAAGIVLQITAYLLTRRIYLNKDF